MTQYILVNMVCYTPMLHTKARPPPPPPLRRSTIHICLFQILRDTPLRMEMGYDSDPLSRAFGREAIKITPYHGLLEGKPAKLPPPPLSQVFGREASKQNYPINEGRVPRWRVSTISALAWTGISLGTFSCWIYQRRCTSRSTYPYLKYFGGKMLKDPLFQRFFWIFSPNWAPKIYPFSRKIGNAHAVQMTTWVGGPGYKSYLVVNDYMNKSTT